MCRACVFQAATDEIVFFSFVSVLFQLCDWLKAFNRLTTISFRRLIKGTDLSTFYTIHSTAIPYTLLHAVW